MTDDGEVLLFEESTARQELEVVWWIRDHNMGIIIDSYKDIASGWKPGAPRPRFKHALVDLASGKIDGIAVLNIDRLTRRKDQVRPILNALEEMGGRLFSLEDELDTADDDPDSNTELRLYQLVERAEREARRTSERMKTVARHRARAGLVQRGGVRPFGHSIDWFALVPEEAELICEAARRVLTEGYWTVAKDWNQRGILTPQGKLWTHGSLRYVLRSPRLIAKRRSNGSLLPLSDVPAILDEGMWLQVQEALDGRSYQLGRKEQRLASNIMLCGICASPVVGNTKTGANVPTYDCRKSPTRLNACGGVSAFAVHVDDVIDQQIIAFLNNKRRIEALLQQHRVNGPEMDAIDARFAELEGNKVALEEAAFNPPAGIKRLPRERYWMLRTQIEREQEQLQRKRVVNREAEPLKAAMKHGWTVESWRAEPMEWRRTILKLVTKNIELHRATAVHRQGLYGTEFDASRVVVAFSA